MVNGDLAAKNNAAKLKATQKAASGRSGYSKVSRGAIRSYRRAMRGIRGEG